MYQSFPDRIGSSPSAQKWDCLNIKNLSGKDVLDLGCNEGYFTIQALKVGARSATGVDSDLEMIQGARRRSSDPTFVHSRWDDFLSKQQNESYDVVFLISALHYAPKPAELMAEIRRILRPSGLLVLEASISEGDQPFYSGLTRGTPPHTDTVWHPTDRRLTALLRKHFVHRYVSPSVAQPGDPISRHIFYAFPRHPIALLISGESGAGKTALSDLLSSACSIYKLDEFVRHLISHDQTTLGAACRERAVEGRLDLTYRHICDVGLGEEFARSFLRNVEYEDLIVIEGYGLELDTIRGPLIDELASNQVRCSEVRLDARVFQKLLGEVTQPPSVLPDVPRSVSPQSLRSPSVGETSDLIASSATHRDPNILDLGGSGRARLGHLLASLDQVPEMKFCVTRLEDAYLVFQPGYDGLVFRADKTVIRETAFFSKPTDPTEIDRFQSAAIVLDEHAFVSVDSAWRNYYHWLVIAVARAILYRKLSIDPGVVLFPSYGARTDSGWPLGFGRSVYDQTRRQFGLEGPAARILPDGVYRIKYLDLCSMNFDQSAFITYLDEFFSVLRPSTQAERGRRKIILSRAASPRITPVAAAALNQFAEIRGYEFVSPEFMDWEDQLKLFASASHIVGAHGAGLTNLVFANPSAKVLELGLPFDGENFLRPWFYLIAQGMGQRYSVIDISDDLEQTDILEKLIKFDCD